MFCVRMSVTRRGKQTAVPRLSSMCFTYCLGSFFTCHVFSAVRLQKLYYWIHLCVSHDPVSVFVHCVHLLWTATHMPMFTNVSVQSSSALHDGNTCKEAILLTFLRILGAVSKDDMLCLVNLGDAKFVKQIYPASFPCIVLDYKLRLSRIVMCVMVCIISTTF